jgi:hypothetical protein
VAKGKLTRQELGWLLTQEAQGAAERLRKGVTALTQAPPPPGADSVGVDATLHALDDAMRMLSTLHSRPSVRGRRGRIDLASLLWEVAPDARVSIEPGAGTQVFGDESELRRMLHVLLGHGTGSGSVVTVRREGDEVVVAVMLGPDSSATAETERAWLARMAIRYGGRWELEGSTEVLSLPAEGIDTRDDVAALRKELDEARAQGEAYARELAHAWTSGTEVTGQSSYPPPATPAAERFSALARLAGGVASTLRAMASPIDRELAEVAARPPRKSSPDLEAVVRTEGDPRVESVRRKLASMADFVAELAALGEVDPLEVQREVDIFEIFRAEAKALEARATRFGVGVAVRESKSGGEGAPAGEARATARVAAGSASLLARELIVHAVQASPRGTEVVVTVMPQTAGLAGGGLGTRVLVDDCGTAIPAAARRALLALEVEPGTFGRPNGVALFVANEVAAAQGALLELGDTPVTDGKGGGLRVTLSFPR